MGMMKAARLHEIGTTFSIDEIAIPAPRPTDVLVKVKACGIIPNMKNVMAHYAEWFPFLPLPPLPAIYGLDASGEVVDVGSQVPFLTDRAFAARAQPPISFLAQRRRQ